MVDYWLGPKWEGIDEDNPMRLAFVLALNCDLLKTGYKFNEDWFIAMAKGYYDESVLL